MNWDDVDNKHLRNYPDKSFVACDEPYERKFIVDTILENFPSSVGVVLKPPLITAAEPFGLHDREKHFSNVLQNN